MNENGSPSVVLVHGGFVDGSGWQGVYDALTSQGIDVDVVQNQTLSLVGDVATTRHVLDQQAGPVVLVGHSYGGAVITDAAFGEVAREFFEFLKTPSKRGIASYKHSAQSKE
jgi:pimeloyl-ACP methyl ester carboxylesterase